MRKPVGSAGMLKKTVFLSPCQIFSVFLSPPTHIQMFMRHPKTDVLYVWRAFNVHTWKLHLKLLISVCCGNHMLQTCVEVPWLTAREIGLTKHGCGR